jgi:nucleotide-binding universal stress UspA family protein
MKKILIAFDGRHYSEGAMNFARQLNEKNPIMVTGAFLPQADIANLWSYSGGGRSGVDFIPLVEESDADVIKENIERFEAFCKQHTIRHEVHKDYFDFAVPGTREESRYADLLLLSSESFFQQAGTDKPNEYLQEALHGVECPVLVIPEKFDFPQMNILSYDGTETSVYALKQFAYLFPEFAGNPTLLVFASEKGRKAFPAELNVREWAGTHFPDLTLFELEVNPKKYFATWLEEKKGAVLVCGAFGRSEFSMLFRKSFITDVIADHKVPVFIAHK